MKPLVVLEGAPKAGLTTAGHAGSITRRIITCLRFLRGKRWGRTLPQGCLYLSLEAMVYVLRKLMAGTRHAVIMRLQGKTFGCLWKL